MTSASDIQLVALATHLFSRRMIILAAWREAIHLHPDLNTGTSLPRAQLNDHIPALLELFEKRLDATARGTASDTATSQKRDAAAHGLQRWQQGYDLQEVTREWAMLHLVLVDELDAYFEAGEAVDPGVGRIARRALAELVGDGVCESAAQYFELDRIDAAGHVRDLETALAQLRELEAERGNLLQQAAHDLRGNLSVVTHVAAGLARGKLPESRRDDALRMLGRNVTSLRRLLDDVTDLARLQAGRERRSVGPFDAAALLQELGRDFGPLAEERKLSFDIDGPAEMRVEGDSVKTRRIAQNLVLNAIKYTLTGGVTLSWGESGSDDRKRWVLSVRDTGPGFHAGPGAPLTAAIGHATEVSHSVDDAARAGSVPHEPDSVEPAPSTDPRPVAQPQGEGIGLSIVKRLCVMLDATIELESTPGKGTTFRVLLPRAYGPQA